MPSGKSSLASVIPLFFKKTDSEGGRLGEGSGAGAAAMLGLRRLL